MSDLGTWRAKRSALSALLDEPDAADNRDALKKEIIALFKAVEQNITEMTALKEEIRNLVEKWKTLQGPTSAPQFAVEKPVVHADHIGASTFIEKGWSRLSLGDYEGAEKALVKAIELSPGDPQSEALLGWAQMLQEKYDDALMNFQRVLMREPQNALARINVGYICLKKGIFGEAIEHLSKALRQEDDARARLYANFYLGLVYTEREMYDDAQIFFERAIALGPNLVEAYYELGHALWRAGDHSRAVATWKRGAAVNKFNPWSARCAEMLATAERGNLPARASLARGD